MKKIVLIGAAALGVVFVFLVAWYRPHFYYYHNLIHPFDYFVIDTDYKLIDNAKKVKIGMSEKEVINLLGLPGEIDKRPLIPQTHGELSQYGKGIKNPNKCYWYSTGIDYLVCIIFNEKNEVVYINSGGT